MTNEILAQGGKGLVGVYSVIVHEPLPSHIIVVVWLLLNLAAPALSIILCVRAWRQRVRWQHTHRTRRIILGAALLASAATAVTVLVGLYNTFYMVATMQQGAPVNAMHSLNIARQCSALAIGAVAASLCLLCALCLPLASSDNRAANKASECVTSEPAPGADSSTHQG